MKGTVFIIADSLEEAGSKADEMGLNQEDTRRSTYIAADGSNTGHAMMMRRPATYINLTGREFTQDVRDLVEWLDIPEEEQ